MRPRCLPGDRAVLFACEGRWNVTPWELALAENRTYLTPEDITEALYSGCDLDVAVRETLGAISAGKAEDASLCAFVAWKAMPVPRTDSAPTDGWRIQESGGRFQAVGPWRENHAEAILDKWGGGMCGVGGTHRLRDRPVQTAAKRPETPKGGR